MTFYLKVKHILLVELVGIEKVKKDEKIFARNAVFVRIIILQILNLELDVQNIKKLEC
jgi:hypothetical protein